jgi:parvulin-like peptidyl-prolyl isomerase
MVIALKTLSVLVFAVGWLAAQTPPNLPNLPDNTVIAVFEDGAKFTMGDFKNIYGVLPQNLQQGAMRDRKAFLEQWALFRKLAGLAEKKKLDQISPNKEAIEYNRMNILSQAIINDELMTSAPDPGTIEKYYDANKERYKQVKVKAIYISFTNAPASQISSSGKKLLTKEEAEAKARSLVAQIRGGADFVKLVKENSDDATSRDKDGDFATLQPADKLPDAIKNAVFALKAGEIADPVEQANGYYILRADQIEYKPLADVRSEILESMKQDHFRQWMEGIRGSTKVEFPAPEFLGEAGPPKQ